MYHISTTYTPPTNDTSHIINKNKIEIKERIKEDEKKSNNYYIGYIAILTCQMNLAVL